MAEAVPPVAELKHKSQRHIRREIISKPFDKFGVRLYTIREHRKEADTMRTEEEARRALNQARDRYDRENTKQIKFKFNLKTDADILSKLQAEPNTQGYIKRLIREDIERNGG